MKKELRMNNVIFLTGATGFVGANILIRILERDETATVVALIRADSVEMAQKRLEEVLCTISPEQDPAIWDRIQLLPGDITLENLGLDDSTYTELSEEVTHVIHAAASVQFTMTLEMARKVNVDGTKRVMAFARRAYDSGSLRRVAYVSTAYVSGSRSATIHENDDLRPNGFSNTYEQSKYEADSFVRSLMKSMPIMVFRPSIIVGDSETGRTPCFNVLYPMLRLLQNGSLSVIPGSPETPADVVPVDFVCDALYHIFFDANGKTGQVYHLAAGHRASTLHEVASFALDFFHTISGDRNLHHIRFIPSILYRMGKTVLSLQSRALSRAMEIYEPYLFVRRTFDNSNTVAALQGSGIVIPTFVEYGATILGYCIKFNWGKRLRRAA